MNFDRLRELYEKVPTLKEDFFYSGRFLLGANENQVGIY